MSGASDGAPRWRTQAAAGAEPDYAEAPCGWLYADRGSLTERLTALSGGRFAVEVIAEGWQALRPDECQALEVPPASPGWVREVWLRGAGEAWVFARSVAAREALEAADFDLAALGERPLGHWLFQAPAFVRGPLEACRYPLVWLPAGAATTPCWARRSVFRRGPLAILVGEVFLPAFWPHARRKGGSNHHDGSGEIPGPL
ncbi:chorismate--pyruvate lyase family protein [Pseudomonas oryzihabitans]|uniref:chorismate--pyruvate lyase family protein n=1 Tax=Pseudomonas oryzihabitans TaxID=47885 RepID=UPI001D5A9589|nr:chorismate lyase [Pseudomonas oryzihabitans]HJE67969.1 chorismate lyase [Pseudomonas oryzihabitans]